MSENPIMDVSVFERRVGELLGEYARLADRPFDSIAIAGVAAGGTHRPGRSSGGTRILGRNLGTASALLILLARWLHL